MLEGAVNDNGKVTRVGVKDQLKTIPHDDEPDSEAERLVLMCCLTLIDAESRAAKSAKEARSVLDQQVLARYITLTESEIKTLVVEDKWFADIRAAIEHEVQRLTQRLAGRVKELEQRYARPLPDLERVVEELGAKVERHLMRMGIKAR